MRPDFDAIRERIAQARAESPEQDDGTEPEPETAEQISRRMFEGGDLSDTAARMFRY